ncbi:MAG: nitroreductase family deazaflavin-dependent oxidoreductase [Acidimicrobiia bacterium]|nr:nitroreductase family deazaflavin-dependent oxidoreductase [Acidimicrobiia bacterium]
MNLYQRTLRRMATLDWVRRLLSKVLAPLDLKLRNTRFAPSKLGIGVPLCYLTTTGRKSGEPRVVPLLFVEHDAGYAVAATNFGTEHHPGWAYNLEADPAALIEIDGEESAVSARLLDEAEAASLWPKFGAVWPAYDTYQQIAPRDIKMFALTPAP